jgi:hypothetical protein
MDAPYVITFVADEQPDVRAVHATALDVGLRTTPEGGDSRYAECRVNRDLWRNVPSEQALTEVEEADSGVLYMFTPSGVEIGITFPDTDVMGEWWGRLRVFFQTIEIDRSPQDSSQVRTRIEEIVDLVAALTPIADPEYVWSAVSDENERHDFVLPDGRPIADNVDDLSWITVMSPDVIEQFGGRDHALETPTWRTEEFDSGHIMLVLRNHPYKPTDDRDGSWKRHLLR